MGFASVKVPRSGLARLAVTAASLCLACLTVPAQTTKTKSGDRPTTAGAKPIKLKPILKKQPVTVKLDPVFKKAEPPKPASAKPEPAKPEPVKAATSGPAAPKSEPPPASAATAGSANPAGAARPAGTGGTNPPEPPAATGVPATPASPPTPLGASPATAATDAGSLMAGELPPAAPKPLPRLTAPQLMAQGLAYLEKGEGAAARERFLKLAKRYPEAPETPEALYRATDSLADPAESLVELAEIAARFPTDPVIPLVRMRQAEFAFALGRHAESAEAYRAVLATSTDAETLKLAERRLVLCLLRTGPAEEFAAAANRMIEKNPEMAVAPEITAAMADLKLAAGDTAGAEALFSRLEKTAAEPGQAAAALLGRAFCAELTGRSGAARELYDRVSKEHPTSPEATLAAYRLVDLSKPLLP